MISINEVESRLIEMLVNIEEKLCRQKELLEAIDGNDPEKEQLTMQVKEFAAANRILFIEAVGFLVDKHQEYLPVFWFLHKLHHALPNNRLFREDASGFNNFDSRLKLIIRFINQIHDPDSGVGYFCKKIKKG